MKLNLIFLFFLFSSFVLYAQNYIVVSIPLPLEISSSNNEYNGMVLRNGKLLLFSQFPVRKVYALDTLQIHGCIVDGNSTIACVDNDSYSLSCVNDLTRQFDGYEGFESAVAVGNSLFFTIETENENKMCYVVKGSFDNAKSKNFIFDSTIYLPLNKTEQIDNAGFEAMAYLPGSKKLIAFFECNLKKKHTPMALVFDTTLTQTPDTFYFDQELPMRLTDVYAVNDTTLIGINYNYWKDTLYHPQSGIVDRQNGEAIHLNQYNYSRLITLHISKNKTISYTTVGDIECTPKNKDAGNFETIIPFYKGYLILTDEYPRPTTELLYIEPGK